MTGFSKVSNGVKYHLHKKGHLFFFSKKPSTTPMPKGYIVKTNSRTGLPFIKKGGE